MISLQFSRPQPCGVKLRLASWMAEIHVRTGWKNDLFANFDGKVSRFNHSWILCIEHGRGLPCLTRLQYSESVYRSIYENNEMRIFSETVAAYRVCSCSQYCARSSVDRLLM